MTDTTKPPARTARCEVHYDCTRPAQYHNGRVLMDDVYDTRMVFLTHGRVTSDGVTQHDEQLTEFAFLGLPNAQPAGGPQTLLTPDSSEN
jgi:hypothetical protein